MLEKQITDYMDGKGALFWLAPLLFPVSLLFRFAAACRNFAYDKKWLKSAKLSSCVVSVGNIVCGGAGKTPLITLLAKHLGPEKRAAILSRGYLSLNEKEEEGRKVDPLRPDPRQFGDEPTLLATKLPSIPVWVGKNRIASGLRAEKEGAQLLFLDDGFQYRRLQRDFELVILDGKDLFGRGWFLPSGLLRDSPKRLKEADYIFINHIKDLESFEEAKKRIKKYSKSPIIGVRLVIKTSLSGVPVGVFCALGRPGRFVDSVESAGARVLSAEFALDHRSFTAEHLEKFACKCKALGAEKLLCTEKDWVKLPSQLVLPLPVEAVRAEMEVFYGNEQWNQLLQRVKSHE